MKLLSKQQGKERKRHAVAHQHINDSAINMYETQCSKLQNLIFLKRPAMMLPFNIIDTTKCFHARIIRTVQ